MAKPKKFYKKPQIKSSVVKIISYYGRGPNIGTTDAEYIQYLARVPSPI